MQDIIYTAELNGGAYANNKRIIVSPTDKLQRLFS